MSGVSDNEKRMVDASESGTAPNTTNDAPMSSSSSGDREHKDVALSSDSKRAADEKAHAGDVREEEGINDSSLLMTKEEEKRLLRKIDWAIVPYCSLLYLLSFLDRVNIGQAAVAGLKADLGITGGNSYAVALSLFFVGECRSPLP